MEGNRSTGSSESEKRDDQKTLGVAQGTHVQKNVEREAVIDKLQKMANVKKGITTKKVANIKMPKKNIFSEIRGAAWETVVQTNIIVGNSTEKGKTLKHIPQVVETKMPKSKGLHVMKVVKDPREKLLHMRADCKDKCTHGGLKIEEGVKEKPSSSGSVPNKNIIDIQTNMIEDKQKVDTSTGLLLDVNTQQSTSGTIKFNTPIEEQEYSPSGLIIKTELKEIPFPTKIIMNIDADEYFIQDEPIRMRNVKKKILQKFPFFENFRSLRDIKLVFNKRAYLGHSYPKVFWHKCQCKAPRLVEAVERKSGYITKIIVYISCRRHMLFETLCCFVHRHPIV